MINILLVEDEKRHIESIKTAFKVENANFHLSTVSSIEEAGKHIEKKAPDLIIAALHLPDGAGLELLPQDDKGKLYPVIVMTGQSDKQDGVEAIEKGAYDYIIYSEAAFADMPHTVERVMREFENTVKLRCAEETLTEIEEKFNLLSEQALLGICIIQDDTIKYANRMICEISGYPYEELINSKQSEFARIIHPEDRSFVIDQLQRKQAAEKDVVIHYPFRIISETGQVKWVELYSKTVNYKGRPADLLTIIDITEQKLVDEALRISEESYRLLFDKNLAGVYRTTIEGQIVACNEAFSQMLGYASEDEILACNAKDLYPHPMNRQAFVEKLVSEKSLINSESLLRRKDGTPVWTLENAILITDDMGSPALVQGTLIEITERKRTEEALCSSEERYRMLVENAFDAIYLLRERHYEYVNPRFCKITGYSFEELTAKKFNFNVLLTDETKELIEQRYEARERGDEIPNQYQVSIINKLKSIVKVEVSTVSIGGPGEVAVLGIMRDVTEKWELEAQLRQAQKMEAVGRLAGGVAHDFNNLLTVILGNTELALMRLDPNEPLRKEFGEIQNAAIRASDLTRQLLAFSRKQTLQPQVMDLNMVISNMDRMLHRIIGEEIRLVTVPGDDLWRVKVDPGQIEQVIVNLVVNSMDAMPNGGELKIETANIHLSAKEARQRFKATPGDYVSLLVCDNGSGMTEEVKAQIFEPFFTTKEVGKGTGLGLATVYGIIKQSDGYIWVESEPGKGTTFRLLLPKTAGEIQEIERADRLDVTGGDETILVVEDEDAVRYLTVTTLKHLGYRIFEAGTGGDAYLQCKRLDKKVDLIITDVIMPNMGGVEFVELIKKEIWSDVKVLYISGYTRNAIVRNGILDEGTPYLQKPFTIKDLSVNVRQLLDGKKSTSST